MRLFLIFASICSAQTLIPGLSSTFTFPSGSSVNMSVSWQDASPSANVAGLQWTLSLPSGWTSGIAVAGPSAVGAQKALSNCGGPSTICVSGGTAVIQSGVVAIIPLTISSTAAVGSQQITLTNPVATDPNGNAVTISALPSVTIQVNPNTGTTPWFTATAGPVTCRASKVAQTPIRVSFNCFDTYGAYSGSYSANLANGGNGTNYFYIGLSSISGNLNPQLGFNLSCLIQMNGTAGPVMMVNGVTVPANSAEYSCTGYSTSGQGTISWP